MTTDAKLSGSRYLNTVQCGDPRLPLRFWRKVRLGVTPTLIGYIQRGKAWSHV